MVGGLQAVVFGLWSLALGLWPWVFGLGSLVLFFDFVLPPASCPCPCSCLLPPAPAYCFRLPGLIAGSPRLHASQLAGSTEGTSSVASALRGTPTSALPDERSMIDAAATTLAPSPCNAATVSRVEPPVVTTSSTTSTLSCGETEKPRRKTILPFSRSVQMKRAPSARATSWPIMRPPIAGETTVSIFSDLKLSAMLRPNASASRGCCKTSAHCR